jgi:hypothetical protein
MLQNDMGNYELKYAQLPEGYVPMGMKEHQGILYIVSWNPFEKKMQIGSYPSPKTMYGSELHNTFELAPISLKILNFDVIYKKVKNEESDDYEYVKISDNDYAELIFDIIEDKTGNFYWKDENQTTYKEISTSGYTIPELDLSKSSVVFTNNFSEDTSLNIGDKYNLHILDEDENINNTIQEEPFQTFRYFIIDKNKNKFDVTSEVVPAESTDGKNSVTFEHNGWLGAEYQLNEIEVPKLNVEIIENEYTSENIVTSVTETIGDTKTFVSEVFPENFDADALIAPISSENKDYSYNDKTKYTESSVSPEIRPSYDNYIQNYYEEHKNEDKYYLMGPIGISEKVVIYALKFKHDFGSGESTVSAQFEDDIFPTISASADISNNEVLAICHIYAETGWERKILDFTLKLGETEIQMTPENTSLEWIFLHKGSTWSESFPTKNDSMDGKGIGKVGTVVIMDAISNNYGLSHPLHPRVSTDISPLINIEQSTPITVIDLSKVIPNLYRYFNVKELKIQCYNKNRKYHLSVNSEMSVIIDDSITKFILIEGKNLGSLDSFTEIAGYSLKDNVFKLVEFSNKNISYQPFGDAVLNIYYYGAFDNYFRSALPDSVNRVYFRTEDPSTVLSKINIKPN